MQASVPEIVLVVNDACEDMKELLTFAFRDVSMLDKVNKFLESGLSTFVVAKTDRLTTGDTEKILTLYKLADPLCVLLETARASNVQAEIIQ